MAWPVQFLPGEGWVQRLMNVPISLTLLRIFFVPIVVVLLLTKGANMDLWAVGVFLLAAVTDLLDGYLARKRGQITTLGILLDPIADKLLTSAAFISLVELRLVPAWMVVIIVGRVCAGSFRVGQNQNGAPGGGHHGHHYGEPPPASGFAPSRRSFVMDGGAVCGGFRRAVLLEVLEAFG